MPDGEVKIGDGLAGDHAGRGLTFTDLLVVPKSDVGLDLFAGVVPGIDMPRPLPEFLPAPQERARSLNIPTCGSPAHGLTPVMEIGAKTLHARPVGWPSGTRHFDFARQVAALEAGFDDDESLALQIAVARDDVTQPLKIAARLIEIWAQTLSPAPLPEGAAAP